MNLLPEILNIIEHGAFRLPAKDIYNRLEELNNQKEIAKRRWFWELVQNAKDSVADKKDKQVNIKLQIRSDSLIFSHTGNPFTIQDAINLIRPDSSKIEDSDDIEGSYTGRFGTGFLATHILSKTIEIKGIAKDNDNNLKEFSFEIDRTGKAKEIIAESIRKSVFQLNESLNNSKKIVKYTANQNHDSIFIYKLDKTQLQIAKSSLNEIEINIPYVLSFLPQIKEIEIDSDDLINKFSISKTYSIDGFKIFEIDKINSLEKRTFKIATLKDKYSILAFEFEELNGEYFICEMSEKLPKLFCDFPLVGTEKFNLPIVFNSPSFNPKTERNGVWLQDDEEHNKSIFLDSLIPLYANILNNLKNIKWKNTYNIIDIDQPSIDEIDLEWYKENILNSIREEILAYPIVDCENRGRRAIFEENNGTIDFPDNSKKEIREALWNLCKNDSYFILPLKDEIDNWYFQIWDSSYSLTIETLVKRISESENLENLATSMEIDQVKALHFVSDLIHLVLDEEKNLLLEYAILPNQNGIFKKKDKLHIDNIDLSHNASEKLKDILLMLGDDCRDYLFNQNIEIEHSYEINEYDLSAEITKLIKPLLEADNIIEDDDKEIILLFLEWLEENPDKSKELFSDIYINRDRLYTSTLNTNDKSNLVKILRNKNGLDLEEISDIVNEPEIVDIIRKAQIKIKEKEFLTNLGTHVENIFAEVFSKQVGLKIEKVFYGQDFIIKINDSNIEYSIEIKSTTTNSVSMTKLQAKTAVNKPSNYALCVLPKENEIINEDYFIQNALFIINIGELLKGKFEKINQFETSKNNIDNYTDDIHIEFEGNLDTKFKINKNIWSKGLSFSKFVEFLKTKYL